MGYFNALMDPAQLGQGIQNAFMMGQQQRREMETDRALSEYARNQSTDTAAAVTRHDPRMGIQLMDREQQRQAAQQKAQQEAMERQIIGAALNGDTQARQQLAYFNSDLYLKLDATQKKSLDDLYNAIAQQAFSILQQPPEQHAALVQQALQGLAAQGIDTSQFQQTGNATQDLKLALAMAGQLDEWERFSQPSYQAIGEGGLAGFQYGQPIQQNGQVRNFAPDLPPGFVLDGGGAGGNASGGF